MNAIVLAAGSSKRFRSQTPKVLHTLCGRTLIDHVLDALVGLPRRVRPETVVVVVPPGEQVQLALKGRKDPFEIAYAVQRSPLGTGDAAKAGLRAAGRTDELLVLSGDSPLVRPGSIASLVAARRKAGATAAVLTAELDAPGAYGRIVRDGDRVSAIVEARDARGAQRAIREINTSVYAFDRAALASALPKLRRENAQGEYYLTDAVRLLGHVVAVRGEPDEALGTNTRAELAACANVMRARVLEKLMADGVTIVDPATTYVDAGVRVGRDTTLLPLTFLEGATRVGARCGIGPSTRLVDTTVGDDATVTFAVARGARFGAECQVGPYVSARPGTVLKRKAKLGTFVETKNAVVDEGGKVPHLAYMGDITIGKRTNIGAGTITCNYDGSRKHRTVIGDDVFIGTNNSLKAPVRIGKGAYTGASSLVNRDVQPGELVYGVPAQPRRRRSKGE